MFLLGLPIKAWGQKQNVIIRQVSLYITILEDKIQTISATLEAPTAVKK